MKPVLNLDCASDTAPTRQHELNPTDQNRGLSSLKHIDHEVGMDHLYMIRS